MEVFAALAILAFLALIVFAAPSFVSSIGEDGKAALPKADRLVTRPNADDCAQQPWPHFDKSCLRTDSSPVEGARLIKPQ
jgi:hypothetical protein